MAFKEIDMELNNKLKLLTVGSVAGTLAATTGLVMAPVLQERKHIAVSAAIAVVGTIVAVGTLKEVHRIDVKLNQGESDV